MGACMTKVKNKCCGCCSGMPKKCGTADCKFKCTRGPTPHDYCCNACKRGLAPPHLKNC